MAEPPSARPRRLRSFVVFTLLFVAMFLGIGDYVRLLALLAISKLAPVESAPLTTIRGFQVPVASPWIHVVVISVSFVVSIVVPFAIALRVYRPIDRMNRFALVAASVVLISLWLPASIAIETIASLADPILKRLVGIAPKSVVALIVIGQVAIAGWICFAGALFVYHKLALRCRPLGDERANIP